jgi:hypothetical protein
MHRHRRILAGLALLASVAVAGCEDYRWQWSFQSPDDLRLVEQRAREQHKVLFIFYKWYLDSDSNRMHGDVLADNEVGKLFKDTVNIIIDKASGPGYEHHLTRYGVHSPPAFIVVGPDGRYKVFSGYIPKERFIDLIANAKTNLAGSAPRAPAKSR